MAKIENHKYSIQEAFRECFYIVPAYQREYVWTEKEVRQLLDDIDEQITSDVVHEYFIGMVLVSPDSTKNHYEIIDGQQRLTTLFLLLCALKHRFKGEPQAQSLSGLISDRWIDTEGNTQRSLKLDPRYENASEVMVKLVDLDAEPEAVRAGMQAAGIVSFGSLENIISAYTTIHDYLTDTHSDLTRLRKYWGYLANNVVFIQISADVSSALKIFETVNERGVGLNPMDLLKNLLFTNVKEREFNRLKDEWKKITKPLEVANEKPLRFLRYFVMANYPVKNERGDGVLREDEIYDWFVARENAALCNYSTEPFQFVRKIVRNVDHYLAFTDGCGNDGKPNTAMQTLRRLSGAAFSQHNVLLLAASNLPKEVFDHFVVQLESFLFYYIFTKTPTKDLERSFSAWADELRAIADMPDSTDQRDAINAFVSERFQKNMNAKQAELTDALKRYKLDSMQRYRTRYLLAKLTQFVDMAYSGVKKPGPLDGYASLEIEHILPDNPDALLRSEFERANPGASYDDYKCRLGNLTLLEKPINVVVGRNFFSEKKPEYRKCQHYLTSSIAKIAVVGANTSINRINQNLRAFDDWSAATIEERQALLIQLVLEVWKIAPIEVPTAA